jgi:hypothetical protein
VKNGWSYTTTQLYSYLYLYLNLKAIKETKIFAFAKGIFRCDEKKEYRMETAHAVRRSDKSNMQLPADNRGEEEKNCKSHSSQHDDILPREADLKY